MDLGFPSISSWHDQSEKGPDQGRVAWGLVGIETKGRPTQPAAVCVEHSRQTSGFFVDPWSGLVFSTTVMAMTQRGKVQMERTPHGQGLRSQSSTAFTRDNGFFQKSFACQTRRSIEACSPNKKKMKKKKTQGSEGTFNTSFGKHDISAAPHTGQPPTGTAANYCCISCHCRRLSSGHPGPQG